MKYKRSITKDFYLNFMGRIEEFRNKNFLCINLTSSYLDNQIFIQAKNSEEPWHDFFCGCDSFLLCSQIKEWLSVTSKFLEDNVKIEFELNSIQGTECNFTITFFDIIEECEV